MPSEHQPTHPGGAVAVITDIHANLPALQTALARVDELGIERVYCGGDLVGYGPHPNEVCALIAEREIPTIYGNYDYAIARDLHDCGCAYITPHDREIGQQSVEWTLVHTDHVSKDWMRELPFDLRFGVGDTPVHLVHGSPRKVNEYLSRTSRPPCMSAWPPAKRPTSWCSAIRTSRGCMSTAACSSSTAARLANPKTATLAAPSPSCALPLELST
jgi:predicted phosphodiesterase